jgi:serine/threonine-protein kinase HipA
MNLGHFEAWAKSVGVPWRAIKPHLDDVMEKARSLWPDYLKSAPMNEKHKVALQAHWNRLHLNFALGKR